MRDLRDAARQALEALEEATNYTGCEAWSPSMTDECLAVAVALKAALEQPEQTCNCRWVGDVQTQKCTLHEAHVDAIHEWAERAKAAEAKLKQPEQEPVAWMIWCHGLGPAGLFEHKQFAELEFEGRNKDYPDEGRKLLPLYTHPPRREWRGLSKDESLKLWGMRSDGPSNTEITSFARAIEAALKERNA
jgi:hypothetical protein